MTTSRKSFLSFAVACIVALMAATAAFASNSADTKPIHELAIRENKSH